MFERIKAELQLIYSSKAQSNNGKRITYLDMVRGIAIFLVVLGHSGLIEHTWNIWLSTFHLPAFFLVSGMLMELKKEEEQKISKVVLHKIKGIMLPYAWFSLGALLVDLVQILRGKFPWEFIVEHIIQTLTLQGYSVLWFLPVLLLAEILMLVVLKLWNHFIKKKSTVALLAVMISILLAVGAFYGYQALATTGITPFWLAELRVLTKAVIVTALVGFGYLTGFMLENVQKAERQRKENLPKWIADLKPIGLLAGLCLAAINILVLPYIQLMDLNNVNITNPLLYIGLGLTGSLGVLLICRSIPNIPPITFYGQNSLIVMCTHINFYVLYAGMRLGQKFIVPLPGPDGLQFLLGSMAFAMFLEIPVILFIRIFLPFVIGQKYKKVKKTEKKQ